MGQNGNETRQSWDLELRVVRRLHKALAGLPLQAQSRVLRLVLAQVEKADPVFLESRPEQAPLHLG